MDKREIGALVIRLKTYIYKKIFLLSNVVFQPKEEYLLSLRIIFDLAPFVLDAQNDKELFNELYDKGLVIVKQVNNSFIRRSYADYIINVFNRKAFLFSVPAVALVYYEEAEAFFRENNIMDELAITLASKAGINISLENYAEAINNCMDALIIIHEHEFAIDQVGKIYNNLYIAEFLLNEQRCEDLNEIHILAIKTIDDLKKIVGDHPCGKKHVILTNISSLYLYVEDYDNYLTTKMALEQSMQCKDVANVQDVSINDFYRYHFAWFEFYRLYREKRWEDCLKQIESLRGFYPSVFQNTRKMELRIEAAQQLVSQRKSISIRDFCLHFLEYAPSNRNYYSRGLLLSDLQFTSI